MFEDPERANGFQRGSIEASLLPNIAPTGSYATLLLSEYEHAHATLLRAMAELDELTRGDLPTVSKVVDARWHISRASLTRRTLWARVLTHLSAGALGHYQRDLQTLQESDRALLRASCEHVAKWKIDVVMSNWEAYCAASAAIRWKMTAAIGAEKRMLYPMLRT